MQLSEKEKAFSEFFCSFLKSKVNFKYFGGKDDPQRFCISQITNSENVFRWMSKKSFFREPFDKQHDKRAQGLLKSASKHVYQINW